MIDTILIEGERKMANRIAVMTNGRFKAKCNSQECSVQQMTVDQWIHVPDNPIQRNTERRADLASCKHLKSFCDIHRFVYAATIDGEIVCKLDGHTRAELWRRGELDRPNDDCVIVNTVEVDSLEDAKAVYDQLDSPLSGKTKPDSIYGACRENGIDLKSPLLSRCKFYSALVLAASFHRRDKPDIYALIRQWKPTIEAVDSLQLSDNCGLITGAIFIAVRADGANIAGPFFRLYSQNAGTKTEAGMDGVQALHDHILKRRVDGRAAGTDNAKEIQQVAWSAYLVWKAGRRVTFLRPVALPRFK